MTTVLIDEVKKIIEGLLFIACEPLTVVKLQKITEYESDVITAALLQLEQDYLHKGFFLRQVADGWEFATAVDLSQYIEKLYQPKAQQLSKASLETLAIIAYKQPLTRQEIENIRQVNVDGVVTKLLEKGLIKEVGRKESLGHPVLYGTTEDFLKFFGLKNLAALSTAVNLEQKSDK